MEQKNGMFDDLFQQPQSQGEATLGVVPGQPAFDKEEWAAKKQAQREELFANADGMADVTLSDPAALQRFLSKQGKSAITYSVTNTLLILKQRPDQSDNVRHEEEWKKAGRGIRKGEGKSAILLFRRDHEYAGDDGMMKTGFNVHRFFDSSQTYGPPMPGPQQLDMRRLLSALMSNTAVHIRLSEGVKRKRAQSM